MPSSLPLLAVLDWLIPAVCLAAIAVLVAGWIVHQKRREGFGLFGPFFYFDLLRLGRRGRTIVLRVLFGGALLVGLWRVSVAYHQQRSYGLATLNDEAWVAERFVYAILLVQDLALLLLAPIVFGTAIAEERQRGALTLLHSTQVTDAEIYFGKLCSRLVYLGALLLAGLPVLSIAQVLGGVDMGALTTSYLRTLLNLVSVGSICLTVSARAANANAAVGTSYLIVLPLACLWYALLASHKPTYQGEPWPGFFPLLNGHLALWLMCWTYGLAELRERRKDGGVAAGEHKPESSDSALNPPPRPRRFLEAGPVVLPPVGENALLWKERNCGQGLVFNALFWQVAGLFLAPLAVIVIMYSDRILPEQPQYYQKGQAEQIGNWAYRETESGNRLGQRLRPISYLLVYGGLAVAMLIGGFRSARCVAEERQGQTLDLLLTLPSDRREILTAKYQGALLRALPALLAAVVGMVLGIGLGVMRPWGALVLAAVAGTQLLFLVGLGLWLSIVCRSIARAQVFLGLTLLALFAGGPLASLVGLGSGPSGALISMLLNPFAVWDYVGFRPTWGNGLAVILVGQTLFLVGAAGFWQLACGKFERAEE